MRDAIAFAQRTSSRGGAKVIVIYPAERMNAASASALLKTLEEPPGAARLILASAAPQRLLPTVRSRCQSLRLALPEIEVAAAWLAGEGRAIDARRCCWRQLVASRWMRWTGWAWESMPPLWRSLPADVLAGAARRWPVWPLATAIDALQKLCHDALCVAVDAAPRYFPAETVPRGGDPVLLTACGRELLAAARSSEHPWNAALAVEAHVQRVQRALQRTRQGSQTAGGGARIGYTACMSDAIARTTPSAASAARPSVIQLVFREKGALYAAYIPLFAEGGLFVPTNRDYKLGEDIYLLLSLPEDPQRYPVAGKIGWVTPANAPGGRTQGVGVRFPTDEKTRLLKAKIEELLGTSISSSKPTQTI